ncbi:terminase large subunit [Methanosphaera sp.]|uniref:phage terminase large subunit family protein n=1 Tax=Methanosphaera sp. TaxID=2666342 RepID=UPI003D8EBFCD
MLTFEDKTATYIPATDNLAWWGYFINNGNWYPRYFDKYIIRLLYAAEQGRISKILLSVPPRHGKSTLISNIFTSYFLCKYPNEKVILSSYSQGLASELGGQVKDIINYYGQFTEKTPRISQDSKAKNKFHIAKPYTGQMLSVGAAGSILGFGAGLFIIDDPIKSVAEAQSPVIQEKLKDWFTGTAKTRLEIRTNGLPPIMIVIAQRLHMNDLQGIIKQSEPVISAEKAYNILDKGGSIPRDTWVDLNLQAICTNPETDILHRQKGEVLWEEQRDYEWLMAEKKAMGSYLFNAIYQGEPTERDGEIFKREWFYDDMGHFKHYINPEDIPTELTELRYWDTAAGGEHGDETAGVLTSYDGKTIYVKHLHNAKYTAGQLTRNIVKQAMKDGQKTLIKIEYEGGSQTRAYVSDLQHNTTLNGYLIRGDNVSKAGPKNIRSSYLEVACENGDVKFSRSIPKKQLDKMINQLVSFTGEDGRRDDIVDSLSGSVRHWKHNKTKVHL